MLRCSTCSRIYRNGTQQFCTNDGGRLLQTEISKLPFERVLVQNVFHSSSVSAPNFATEKLQLPAEIAFHTYDSLATAPLELPTGFQANYEIKNISSSEVQAKAFDQNQNKFDRISQLAAPQFFRQKTKFNDLQFNRPLIAVGLFAALLVMIGVTFVGAYFLREQKLTGGDSFLAATTSQRFLNETNGSANKKMLLGTTKFRNTKENLSKDSAEHFVKFSISYPNKWQNGLQRNYPDTPNFLNVGNFDAQQIPTEQLIIASYQSNGNFAADNENFPVLARDSSRRYAQTISQYKQVYEGITSVNHQPAYEICFEGKIVDHNYKLMTIWGRTIFLPAGASQSQNALMLTMIATPLAPELSSVADVGRKGELPQILKTLQFEN